MLMGWGPFRFTVPIYSVEDLERRVASRVDSQQVIGRRPTTHLLGPDEETLTLQSTFHPYHMNKAGLAQLIAVQESVRAQIPHMLVHVGGAVFGRWVGREVTDQQTKFHPRSGVPQTITVSLSLVRYVGR